MIKPRTMEESQGLNMKLVGDFFQFLFQKA